MKYCNVYNIKAQDIGYVTFNINTTSIKCYCPSCKKEFYEDFDLRYKDELPTKTENGYMLYCTECYI
jgi:hypothetical protein